ncbi:hypothetical protein FDUTEX481_09344 [Tolypothrix sp. PCC 7601]|nr:hypothetical protein FDUTEX481_09344 [Tolypothrix sp. PCC 7601]
MLQNKVEETVFYLDCAMKAITLSIYNFCAYLWLCLNEALNFIGEETPTA